jgi:hypothetical protein
MPGIAQFARSESGQMYLMACERFGVDPGAAFDDEVVAHNFRVALILSSVDSKQDGTVVIHDDGRHVVSNPGLMDGI